MIRICALGILVYGSFVLFAILVGSVIVIAWKDGPEMFVCVLRLIRVLFWRHTINRDLAYLDAPTFMHRVLHMYMCTSYSCISFTSISNILHLHLQCTSTWLVTSCLIPLLTTCTGLHVHLHFSPRSVSKEELAARTRASKWKVDEPVWGGKSDRRCLSRAFFLIFLTSLHRFV